MAKREGPEPRPNAKDQNQHQTKTNNKGKRHHRHAGRPKPTPNANRRKGKTKPPQTRNSQSQRIHKRPNGNQPQPLRPCRMHSVVLTGRPPRPRFQVRCVWLGGGCAMPWARVRSKRPIGGFPYMVQLLRTIIKKFRGPGGA